MCHHRKQLKCVRLYTAGILMAAFSLSHIQHVHSEAQFFDFFSQDRTYNSLPGKGGGGGSYRAPQQNLYSAQQQQSGYGQQQSGYGKPQERIFGSLLGGGGGGGGGGNYGAPQQSGYGVPQAPVVNRPSYGGQQAAKPSYGGAAKPSYGGGGGKGFAIPNINIPNPIDFKAGVLRSKGRIASGLLHAKAGILRAGANILAQKANALDKVAQAIPAAKAGLINQIQGVGGGLSLPGIGGGGGGGYGAPTGGYGAPQPPPPLTSGYGTPRPSYNGGVPQGTVVPPRPVAPVNNNLNSLTQTFPAINQNQLGVTPTTINGVGTVFTVNQNQAQNLAPNQNQDTYGSPQGNVITGSTNINNFGRGVVQNVDPGLTTSVSGALTFPSPSQQFNNGNNLNNFNNNGNGQQLSFNQNNNQFQQNSNNNPFLSNNLNNNNLLTGNSVSENLLLQESIRQQQSANLNSLNAQRFQNQGQCPAAPVLKGLLGDIFMGHEVIPDILDEPPRYPLDLTYKTIRTYPGMTLTADMTRFKPMIDWPAEPNALYTVVMSNLDINNRRNRTLSEFWHWFVANVPGDNIDEGEIIFELLFPLVLPEGDGDHRFGYFVFKQPQRLDYADEGGPTDACSPNMSNGRGPFKSTKNFQKKYNLELTAATFLIIDYNDESMEIACEWQKCIGDTINLVSPLRCAK